MRPTAINILRVGVAITFIWVGIFILNDPISWGGFIQDWALKLIPTSLKNMMVTAAVIDIFVGLLLLLNFFTWPASILGIFHLTAVLVVSGVNAITVRDIGLLAALISLAINIWPANLNFFNRKNNQDL